MSSTDVVQTLRDYTRLSWSEKTNTSGTAGTFLKARETTGSGTWYYKLSCYDSYRGVYGHECANEVVASRFMRLLGVPHLEYRLVHATVLVDDKPQEVWMNQSRSFRAPKEKKLAFDVFYDLEKQPGETPLDVAERFGWGDDVRQMMVVDYLIANRDRHGANIEVLRDQTGALRLAPLFDNGLSFVFSCYGDEARVDAFDPLQDVNANNFFGTRSLEENVRRFVSKNQLAGCLKEKLAESDRTMLFAGLDEVLPEAHRNKMWEILWKRWNRLEDLCHS